jgi:hypothetical protein
MNQKSAILDVTPDLWKPDKEFFTWQVSEHYVRVRKTRAHENSAIGQPFQWLDDVALLEAIPLNSAERALHDFNSSGQNLIPY